MVRKRILDGIQSSVPTLAELSANGAKCRILTKFRNCVEFRLIWKLVVMQNFRENGQKLQFLSYYFSTFQSHFQLFLRVFDTFLITLK